MGQSIERPQPHRWDDRTYEVRSETLAVPPWSAVPTWAAHPHTRAQLIGAGFTVNFRLRADSFMILQIFSFSGGAHTVTQLWSLATPPTGTFTCHWSIGATRSITPAGDLITCPLPDDLILQVGENVTLYPYLYGRRDTITDPYVRYKVWR